LAAFFFVVLRMVNSALMKSSTASCCLANSRQRFSLLPQVLATHGWLVFEPNYRGGDDQDNAVYASIYKDAGQGPGEDMMAGVEDLKRRGLIDPARKAVTGWSYGGFMTTGLAGHYPVWKAAVAGAPVTDPHHRADTDPEQHRRLSRAHCAVLRPVSGAGRQ